MNMLGNHESDDKSSPDNGGGRTVLVGVKLDSNSKELLTWALVKVAQPGDHVIALHILDFVTESTASLLALVKTFDAVLSVYEGFCNLKQVDLKLKVSRGSSVRKFLVREAEAYSAATLVVGTSKSNHRLRSSASVAKYCARKLSKCFSVFAVNNGKVQFHREAAKTHVSKVKSHRWSSCSAEHTSDCVKKDPTKKCECCAAALVLPDNSGKQPKCHMPDDCDKQDLLDLAPNKTIEGSTISIVIEEFHRLKPGWSLLHQVFLPGKHCNKPPSSVFQSRTKQAGLHSSGVAYPNQKNQIDEASLDEGSGAVVPFGSPSVFSLHSPCDGLISLPEELLHLHEKFSSMCRLYTYEELMLATSNFASENLLGKGGSGHVYNGCLSDGKELAVKNLNPSEDAVKEFVQEIEIITTLHHKNIISLSGFCFENNNLLLVYDFLARGSLEENLCGNESDGSAFGWKERYKVATGVAEALDYLHNHCKQPVVHRDVKSSNILLSDDFEPQLSDFGLASWASSTSDVAITDVAGTFGYMAPEYFMHGRVSDKIDVYAFGVVLLELLSGRRPINNENPKGYESLVMWAAPILKDGKLSELLDPSLGSSYDLGEIERMVVSATLCIRRAPRLRPQISLILKLLQGDEEVTSWAKQQVGLPEELDGSDEGSIPSNIQSHLNLVLLDLEDDDSLSISSIERSVSVEDYLHGRWSRCSSFD